MSEFQTFYELGLQHILDKNGYDHIVFVIALCALYQADDWKRVLVLVTSFTLGHSFTLALSTLSIVNIDTDLVEFLIPVTIFITAIFNLFARTDSERVSVRNYLFAGFFGLIHGLGFSNYLKSLLGKDESIITQLFAFNVGLEVGQVIVVAALLAAGFLCVQIFGVSRRDWKLTISAAVAGVALVLILDSNYL
ncbi:HupE/UreJ family protein [Marinoscillum furvescens]|uniref:HupE/UreJ protein n=1 Tax=Marinoscillum furvescens DSM 4134 TaxID=1122208 RepID=A0A3D9L4X1_MARFU|nr:HupE/UreJ family protein [Marinoscillum furvescens]RED98977.1 HupE/UreJ protein [Marinoscillum furvescens DSM 4134]